MIRAAVYFYETPTIDIVKTLWRWIALARQRRALARLDGAALRDIGVTQSQAKSEANRPFWDAPDTWRK